MAKTPCDLFRAGGKTTGPRMENVRPADVTIFSQSSMDYVKGRGGGVSTYDAKDPMLGGTWWVMPKGEDYDDKLLFLNADGTGHYAWEPNVDMPVSAYKAILATLNEKFTLAP
jgi:hypothetical protein